MHTQKQENAASVPRPSALDHDVAVRLAATEYDRFASLLEQLPAPLWSAPTDCPSWDVRDVAGHVLGMAQMVATLPELARQQLRSQRRAKRDGILPLDALTAHQVDKNAQLRPSEVVAALRRVAPRATSARRRAPGFVRARTMPGRQQVGDHQEAWTLGYLLDVILTRDPFMHRIDITRATGARMAAEPDHEGVIVDDIVREWAGRHDQPYQLVLTGPAGGSWSRGDAVPLELDALEFCRILSGRSPATGALAEPVPF